MASPDSGPNVDDYLGLHPFYAIVFEPEDLAALRRRLDELKNVTGEVRAHGANYSLSETGVARNGYVINGGKLSLHLSQPWPIRNQPLANKRLRNGVSLDIPSLIFKEKKPSVNSYVHVEAGIRIKDLLEDLKTCGLALSTMGAGGEQSVAGALSTATHGGDFHHSNLGDAVCAIHLIDPEGRDLWISRPGSEFDRLVPLVKNFEAESNDASAEEKKADDARFVNNSKVNFHDRQELYARAKENADLWRQRVKTFPTAISDPALASPPQPDTFNAVLTAMGRLGVIYAVILEVEPAYHLIEINQEEQLPAVCVALSVSSKFTGGLFKAPLNLTQFTETAEEFLSSVKLFPDLAASVAGEASNLQLHHLNLAINLANPSQCWVTRRWKTLETPNPNKVGVAEKTASALVEILQEYKNDLPGLLSKKAQEITTALLGGMAEGCGKDIIRDNLVHILKYLADKDAGAFNWSPPSPIPMLAPAEFVLNAVADLFVGRQKIALENLLKLIHDQIHISTRKRGGDRLAAAGFLLIHDVLTAPEATRTMKDLAGLAGSMIEVIKAEQAKNSDKISEQATSFSDKMKLAASHRFQTKLINWLEPFKENPTPIEAAKLLSSLVMYSEFSNPIRVGLATEILDTHNYNMDKLTTAHSAEYFFDETKMSDGGPKNYLQFIAKVTQLAEAHKPVFGYIGIRFMRKSGALLAMQQFEYTVSVEVTPLRSSNKEIDVYKLFRPAVDKAAAALGAIPHWGQQFEHQNFPLAQLYGENFKSWKHVRNQLDPKNRFLTPFTEKCGLEGLPVKPAP